jgi:hypothetical protein
LWRAQAHIHPFVFPRKKENLHEPRRAESRSIAPASIAPGSHPATIEGVGGETALARVYEWSLSAPKRPTHGLGSEHKMRTEVIAADFAQNCKRSKKAIVGALAQLALGAKKFRS